MTPTPASTPTPVSTSTTTPARSAPALPEAVVRAGRQALEHIAQPMDGLQAALLTTPDGFEIASLSLRTDLHAHRVAAMASSLMAMARAVGREVQFTGCKRLTFETDTGVVIFQAIEGSFPSILCLVLDSKALLGRAIWAASEFTQAMEAA